jgi:SAM-dependent methyltransferase
LSIHEDVSRLVREIEGDSDDLLSRLRRVARLALPLDARVAVVTNGNDQLLDLNVPVAVPFPAAGGAADPPATDESLIAELERLQAERTHFLFVPASAEPWLEGRDRLHRHLRSSYRLVLEEEGTGAVFSLQEPTDAPANGIGHDGLPVPPPEMVHLVAGMHDWDEIYGMFLSGGKLGATSITEVLEKNDLDIKSFDSILDFGCGCGRIIRHWIPLTTAKLHGSDYNPYMVEWCMANLQFAEFTVNGVAPPLDYADEQFDFLYAVSIFTHFVETLQVPWAREVARVLRPGGHALLTFSGLGRVDLISPPKRERFEGGELVVEWEERAGTNATAVYHPERYLREVLAPQGGFEIVDFVPDGQKDAQQDSLLLRRI